MDNLLLLSRSKSISVTPLIGNNELKLSNSTYAVVFVIIFGFIFFKASYAGLDVSITNLVTVALLLDSVCYMRNIGKTSALSKRYFTKKTLKDKYLDKKFYSANFLPQKDSLTVHNKHKNLFVTDFEGQISKNYILSSSLQLQDNTFVEFSYDANGNIHYSVKTKTIDFLKLIDKYLFEYKFEYLNKLSNLQSNKPSYNSIDKPMIAAKDDYLPMVGASISNFTTKYNSQLQIVQAGIIKNEYVEKGIFLHAKNGLLAVIKNDKDFERLFFFIDKFVSYDLKQDKLIAQYSNINPQEIYGQQTKKLFSEMPVIINKFNVKVENKGEFLRQLAESWNRTKKSQ
jgi:hypothetical protein